MWYSAQTPQCSSFSNSHEVVDESDSTNRTEAQSRSEERMPETQGAGAGSEHFHSTQSFQGTFGMSLGQAAAPLHVVPGAFPMTAMPGIMSAGPWELGRLIYNTINPQRLLPQISPRLQEEKTYIYFFGGIAEGVGVGTAQRFNIVKTQWEPTARNQLMPHKGLGIGVALHRGEIWIVGGVGVRQTYVYDPINDHWLPQAMLNVHRAALGVVDCSGRLFAIAGVDGDIVLTSMEVYNDDEKRWEVVDAELNQARFNFRATVFKGKIYVYGGNANVNSSAGLMSLEYYYERRWIIINRAERVRKGCFGFFDLDGVLFMAGGDIYNSISVSTDGLRWNSLRRLARPFASSVSGHSVYVEVGYKIYVFGGLVRLQRKDVFQSSAFVYDLASIPGTHDRTFINPSPLPDMVLPRVSPGSILIRDC